MIGLKAAGLDHGMVSRPGFADAIVQRTREALDRHWVVQDPCHQTSASGDPAASWGARGRAAGADASCPRRFEGAPP